MKINNKKSDFLLFFIAFTKNIHIIDLSKLIISIILIIYKNMTTKIGFITDGHLKEKEKSFMKDKRKELLRSFVNESIKNHGINHLVYGGDMFDQVSVETSWETAKFFFKEIVGEVSKVYDIQQDLLVWNHEKRGKRNVYDIMDKNILSSKIAIRDVVEWKEFSDFNAIYIPYLYPSDYNTSDKIEAEKLAFTQVELLSNSMKKLNNKPVIVFNHNIMGGIWFEAEKEMDVKFYDIDSVDFVLGWHIHKKVDFNKGLYVGSFMRSFTYEEEDEGFYVLTIENGKVSGEYVPVKSFDYEKVVVESDNVSSHIWKKDNVYSIEFVFKNDNKDNFIVSNVLKSIENAGGYVKGFKIRKSEEVKIMERVVSVSNSKEEILKAFFSRDKKFSKDEQSEIFNKLLECSEKITKKNDEKLLKDKKHSEKAKSEEKKSIMKNTIVAVANDLIQDDLAF